MNISVCIATYNGGKFIKRQLNSILSQLSCEDEIILIDDCSMDDTVQIVKSLKDSRIKISINDTNLGFVSTFEKCIIQARNEIIFLSDQDDNWFKNKVEKIINVFKEESADLVIHNAVVVNEKNEIIRYNCFEKKIGSNFFNRNFINNHNMGCMMAFRNRFSPILIPFPSITETHDQWIGLNADLLNKKIVFYNENLMLWNRHGNNTSSIKRRIYYKVFLSRIKMILLIIIGVFRLIKRNNYL